MKSLDLQITFKRFSRAFWDFFLKPASAVPIAALRIALGLTMLLQVWIMRSVVFDLFSASSGYIQGELAQTLNDRRLPQIAGLTAFLSPYGFNESFCIFFVCFAYVASLILLTVGWQTRFAAIVAWFTHWMLMNTANSTTYGVDQFAHVFLFYMIWIPAGSAWSIDARTDSRPNPKTSAARLGLRLLQLHLCLAYLVSGIDKAQGIQWWNGELMWRALQLPVYRQFDMNWLANYPVLSMVTGWSSLLLELGYCIFIWPRKTRRLWIAGIVGLHIGIMIFLGLHLFGLIMALLTACLFGLSPDKVYQPKVTEERLEVLSYG